MSDETTPAAQVAVDQQANDQWPRPGDEGYVHPDGTPQSQQQLAANRRAAADRAAAGSTVHGAPAATPGPQVTGEAEAAAARADAYDGPTAAEARAGLTQFVREGERQRAEETAAEQPERAPEQPRSAREAKTRTATTDQDKTNR